MTIDIDTLEALARAATSGEWRIRPRPGDDWGWMRAPNGCLVCVVKPGEALADGALNGHRRAGTDPAQHNLDFIAAVQPMAMLDLVDAYRALQKRAEAAEEDLRQPRLRHLRVENGALNMELVGAAVENMALLFTEQFRASGAQNYIEMNLNAPDEPFERYCVFVQKVGAKSPHQLREEAEAALVSEKARVRELEGDLAKHLLPAYHGLLVLKTLCKKQGFSQALGATENALATLEEIAGALPGLAALRLHEGPGR